MTRTFAFFKKPVAKSNLPRELQGFEPTIEGDVKIKRRTSITHVCYTAFALSLSLLTLLVYPERSLL